jgi:hypothetical protein
LITCTIDRKGNRAACDSRRASVLLSCQSRTGCPPYQERQPARSRVLDGDSSYGVRQGCSKRPWRRQPGQIKPGFSIMHPGLANYTVCVTAPQEQLYCATQ